MAQGSFASNQQSLSRQHGHLAIDRRWKAQPNKAVQDIHPENAHCCSATHDGHDKTESHQFYPLHNAAILYGLASAAWWHRANMFALSVLFETKALSNLDARPRHLLPTSPTPDQRQAPTHETAVLGQMGIH